MPRTRPPYPKEFREEAVRLVKESGKPVSQISRELGVSVESLRGVGKAPRHRCGRARGPDYRRGRRAEEATPGKPDPPRGAGHPKKSRRLLRSGDQQDPVAVFTFVEREKADHPGATMCRLLGVSTSGYYDWQKRPMSSRARQDAELTKRIIEIYRSSRGTYGAPRIHAELVMGSGIRCSKKRVAGLIRQAGLQGIHRRRLRGCTRMDPARPACPDLVNRTFKADAPDRLWVADFALGKAK